MSPQHSTPTHWDLIVIGSGSAGIVAAKTAGRFGARVLLVERHRLGGDCLWTGCVPSKSLIAAAHAAHVARSSERFGVTTDNVTVDFARVMGHVQSAVATIEPHDSAEAFAEFGIEVAHGTAQFTGRHALEIDGVPHTFAQAVIATGTVPRVPTFTGTDSIQMLTSDSMWELDELPARLVVLGGGAIGSELGQAMARLGSDVTIVNRSARILPAEEERASAVLQATFDRDGITVLHGRSAVEVVSSDGLSGEVVLDDGSRVPFDRVLAAIGRTPNLGTLSPETAGVALTEQGYVDVDASLRTANKHIWSAGDVAGLPKFSHIAGVSGGIAGTNAILGLRRKFNEAVVPRVTFTSPEIAAVGLTASDAVDGKHRVFTGEHSATDRAIAEGEEDGFAQIVVSSSGRVLGGTIVGPRAGESLGELTVAVSAKLSTSTLAGATHAYPTFSDALWTAAIADVQYRLKSGIVASAIQLLVRVRRAIVGKPRD
ncbi:FAD-dependent oxidoreductase [Salinibacterium sp. UTAS2018]|uniref:dihydrolipoyl dehydrogenase family protein n=1 Tax=Salinibacterium sp. UTAS2018 TaxID=2508880 RepID=UPI0010095679|nr:FAD-dependent oxidoreductase [Salinibacterium sp. UTAS2018]QAV70572.1 FAD-dependent oxidoreductase [Salinibacterium sp. UTAS2018]